MGERMKLAEDRPLRRRMMAAMAQQDCGQCGYNCHDYSEALFRSKEARLNLCVPGGKETARMLKTLYVRSGRCAGHAGHVGSVPPQRSPSPQSPSPNRDARATIRRSRDCVRALASTSLAHRRKPGMSSSSSRKAD